MIVTTTTSPATQTELCGTGKSLAVASAVARMLSGQIAPGQAAPELISFEDATPEQVARLTDAPEELAQAVVEFLRTVQPALNRGAHERMALAEAEASHAQEQARHAAQQMAK